MKPPYLLLAFLLLPVAAPSQSQALAASASNAVTKASSDIQAYFKSLNWEQKKQFVWEGGTNSLAGRSVCAAEGNCNSDGSLTSIASGHVDPGNAAANMGRYSYQMHLSGKSSMSIEEADQVQGQKLLNHTDTLSQRLASAGLNPQDISLREFVSGIDVANQCPLCLTEPQAYAEHLKVAKDKGLSEVQAVEEARINAYIDPNTGQYNAPGLRAYDDISKHKSIEMDVQRREAEIQEALQVKLNEIQK
jgi:hypothetical protein